VCWRRRSQDRVQAVSVSRLLNVLACHCGFHCER
jgi:hypothetical protein